MNPQAAKVFRDITTWVAAWFAAGAGVAAAAGFPDPAPVFLAADVGRLQPRLHVQMMTVTNTTTAAHEMRPRPELRAGNKAVVVRWSDGVQRPAEDHVITVVIDGKAAAQLVFWGDDGKGAFGYPFRGIDASPARLTWDESSDEIIYEKPYRTPSGAESLFTYRLRPLSESQVEVAWDCGAVEVPQNLHDGGVSVGLWLSVPDYRSKRLSIGEEPFKFSERSRLQEEKRVTRAAAGDLMHGDSNPTGGFAVRGDRLAGSVIEAAVDQPGGAEDYLLEYRFQPTGGSRKGHLVIDLQDVSIPTDTSVPPVGGVDFWGIDATHVPASPVRNLMPNPSFEQGLRYWTWMHGGARYTPSPKPRYSVVEEGLFGPNALLIRDVQASSSGMISFPLALDAGESYTLSFHARGITDAKLTASLASASKGGRYRSPRGPWGDVENPDARFAIGRSWRRFSRTFIADSAGICIGLQADKTILIDGIQLEKGTEPTAFVAPPLDGFLITANKDNALHVGQPINAQLAVTGTSGTRGVAVITAKNAFNEPVYRGRGRVIVGRSGVHNIPLPFDTTRLGEGVFVVQVVYDVPGFPTYTDYHRLAIIRPLSNRHPTKDLCGTIGAYDYISRGEDLALRLMEWGFGSTSWGYDAAAPGERVALEAKYRIANIANVLQAKDPVAQGYMTWRDVPDDLERRIEEAAFRHAVKYDRNRDKVWAFGNEEEGSYLVSHGLFEQHLRVQLATARGVRRAIPDAIMLPTCGTSGYSKLRGYDAIEGYLSAAQRSGYRYGGIAVHPYGSIDGGTLSMHDLDEETSRLVAQMERFGYGDETPIFYTEMFNVPEAFIPAWKADACYDDYSAGKPTYDFGNREFVQAASAARAVIIMAKYWPRLRSANLWVSRPFMDMRLTPLLLCKAINTIGNELDDVQYVDDVRPSPAIRGYVFERADGMGVAPLWCVDKDVENGLKKGPAVTIKSSQSLVFRDFMGRIREEAAGDGGTIRIPLTPAPLFIEAANASLLAEELRGIAHDDTSFPVELAVLPSPAGGLAGSLKNLTGRNLAGRVLIDDQIVPYSLDAHAEQSFKVDSAPQEDACGHLLHWSGEAIIQDDSEQEAVLPLNATWFYVPRSRGNPDWDSLPANDIVGRFGGSLGGEAKAALRMAWDEEYLYVGVDFTGNANAPPRAGLALPPSSARHASPFGLVEFYLDTAANGGRKIGNELDSDDYRYDFLPAPDGKLGGRVDRVHGVYHQLADGTNMPTVADVAAEVECDFEETAGGYRMTTMFRQRFILPTILKPGASFGVGLVIHQPESARGDASPGGATLVWKSGHRPCRKPSEWPIAVLLP